MKSNRVSTRLAFATLASSYFIYYTLTAREWHFIDMVNLIFHEAGHTLFMFFGDFIHAFMGSGFQVLLPLSIALYFFYTGQRFSGALCLFWVGQNVINVSIYAGDAVVMQLPLLGGDSVIHDWNYLLGTLNVLRYTPQIAGGIYALGILILALAIVLTFRYAMEE